MKALTSPQAVRHSLIVLKVSAASYLIRFPSQVEKMSAKSYLKKEKCAGSMRLLEKHTQSVGQVFSAPVNLVL